MRRVPHSRDNLAQLIDRQTFFDDEGRRKRQGAGTHDREVVHRAVDRQVADAASRERQGVHDIGVGRKGQAPVDARKDCGVAPFAEQVVAISPEEDLVDEGRGRFASRAVGQGDAFVGEAGGPRSDPIDVGVHLGGVLVQPILRIHGTLFPYESRRR